MKQSTRRDFLKTGTAATAGAFLAGAAGELAARAAAPTERKLIWAYLAHLSYNMWCDWDYPRKAGAYTNMTPDLRFDEQTWNEILKLLADAGLNMVVIDLGDGVKYESHPEIAVKGAWSTARLREELARCRKLGLEPIPKLNFSTTHDAWLKDYSRQVSTAKYYAVCSDLIAEVIRLFDKPRFFHLGMDEETAQHQVQFEYVVVRQYNLWWHDFLRLVEAVEKGGSRPWIWSDYVWNHADLFYQRMPKSVLQSNWYYGDKFDKSIEAVKPYGELDGHGYDQVLTGSNWTSPKNFELTVEYCRNTISPQHLLGFFQTAWRPTLPEVRQKHVEAIEQVGRAIKAWKPQA